MRAIQFSLAFGASAVLAALNLDGTQAVDPVTDNDPSPIGDPNTYYPDQHDCPLPCSDVSNTHSWIPYFSVERLQRCQEPMLLQFSASSPLDESSKTVLIRSCTINGDVAAVASRGPDATSDRVQNPKKASGLFETSLDIAPACAIGGAQVEGKLELVASSGDGTGDIGEVIDLLSGLEKFFNAEDNCDENFIFAYHKQTVASVYIGAGLGKPTIGSVIKALNGQLQASSSIANHTIAQLCDAGRKAETVLGISIDTTGDLAAVQKLAFAWSEGICASDDDLKPISGPVDITVFDIAAAPMADTTTLGGNMTSARSLNSRLHRKHHIGKRDTCTHVQFVAGDGCASLAAKCGIRGSDFAKYNPQPDLCTTLKEGDYVCCSAGDPYTDPKPAAPQQGSDGTCATHFINNGDTCAKLAETYGLTVDQIEAFNKGKTWAWTECKAMLIGYNMCLSNGTAPLPPPQEGTECGPLVPGTLAPTDPSVSLADLNPCPLKACCSNWGFCGPFPAHCDIHAPEGGGPGSKLAEFQSTCVSNCGMEIKQSGGPPAAFQRIGYYESWNMDRDCLWLSAGNANTDGSYTHIHWGFAEIDPDTWKLVINDPHKQWDAFKKLGNVKRIVSFGGWAYSTEAATYNIMRQAIINNRETFASNIAQFLNDEGIDGVDIDWEYPGAPDILVDGAPIGQTGDGVAYLRFLTSLKSKVGDKSVSIAAPASYWYLKAFPIDKIAAVIDYIVYMTYDLHGQWDFGNVNAFDSCPSGKCIRSHVNLTETRNSLGLITKAGVPNNKIFVGESSYGRSFHMAQDGCWGPMCDFTGSRTVSDAQPGRCTKTGGYISNAEINEIIRTGDGVQQLHDGDSNTDILLYLGDYISYMTPTTKDTRRTDWKNLDFAGSIDWAVDLQSFTSDDLDSSPDRGDAGQQGCIAGRDLTINSWDLCEFSCNYGFCPESLCTCTEQGTMPSLPGEVAGDIIAWDSLDVDLNRLCKFACKYGYCPQDVCTTPVVDADEDGYVEIGDDPNNPNWYSLESARLENQQNCEIFQDSEYRDASVGQCEPICHEALEEAKEEGRTSSYGCVGFYPLDQGIPWTKYPGGSFWYAPGKCSCDNFLVNEIADLIIDAFPIIAEIGCYIVMSSLKAVLDIGADLIPGVGKILDAGLDMAATAAQMAAYIYPDEEDPEGAFSWWLSPCGGTDLVPDDIKEVFGILSTITDGVSSFKKPEKIQKGSGKKGDDANPTDRSKPKAGTGRGPNGTGSSSGNGVTKKKKCKIPVNKSTTRLGAAKNTLREQSCVNDKTEMKEMIITSLAWPANAAPTQVAKGCEQRWSQACFHYSSAIRVNPQWGTLSCPQAAATTAYRFEGSATASWQAQHTGAGWRDVANRGTPSCDMDEYPPAHLLDNTDPAWLLSGKTDQGQLVRYLPGGENRGAGSMWRGVCFAPPIEGLSDTQFRSQVNSAAGRKSLVPAAGHSQILAEADVNVRPEFTINSWAHAGNPPSNDGLDDNTCWPSGIAAKDPGFTLLTYDKWYTSQGRTPQWDYKQPYVKGSNGN